MPAFLPDLVLLVVLLICFYTDLKQRKIYNKVLFPAMLAGLLLSYHAHGPAGLLSAAQGFLLGAALLLLPFAAGGLGAGDLKLLAVIGLFKGAAFVFQVFLAAALLGGVLAVLLLLWRGRLYGVLKNVLQGLYLLLVSGFRINPFPSLAGGEGEISLPYAPVLVLGTFLVFFLS